MLLRNDGTSVAIFFNPDRYRNKIASRLLDADSKRKTRLGTPRLQLGDDALMDADEFSELTLTYPDMLPIFCQFLHEAENA